MITMCKTRKEMLEIIEYRHLIDTYRHFFPDKIIFTWRKKYTIETIPIRYVLGQRKLIVKYFKKIQKKL